MKYNVLLVYLFQFPMGPDGPMPPMGPDGMPPVMNGMNGKIQLF